MNPPIDEMIGEIGVRMAGDGEVVLFLHGLGGSRTAWEPQLEALGDRFRCVAWDLPGYGASTPIDPLTFEAIAEAAAGLIESIGVERAHVVGLSFGGQQAMHLALHRPDLVDRLVLADTSARFGADGTDADDWKRLRLDPLDHGITPADMAAAVLDAITGPDFAGIERDRTIAAFGRIPSDGLRAAVECLPSHDVSDRLGEIRSPTLVIVGELDEETPSAYAETLADQIPDAELRTIAGVGHLTPAEAPSRFNQLVRSFLTGETLGV